MSVWKRKSLSIILSVPWTYLLSCHLLQFYWWSLLPWKTYLCPFALVTVCFFGARLENKLAFYSFNFVHTRTRVSISQGGPIASIEAACNCWCVRWGKRIPTVACVAICCSLLFNKMSPHWFLIFSREINILFGDNCPPRTGDFGWFS